uniref:Cytochrome p450 n=1 Tax=Daphnia magna TaxID=35525 RepID=A0A0N8BX03_9CRUS
MLFAVICLAAAVIIFIYLRWEYSSYVKTIDLIPGPPKVAVFGNALLLPRDIHESLQVLQEKWPKMYGRMFRVWFGSQAFIDISSPALMEEIMSSQKFINKGEVYDPLLPWLGEGLLTAPANKWRKRRRLLTPAFHFQILDNFFDIFNKNADILCQQLCGAANSQTEIEVFPFLKRCTLDIICEAAMGIQVNAQLEDTQYIISVQRFSFLIFEKFMSIWRLLPDWMYFLSAKGKEYKKHLKVIHDFTSKVIRDRKKEIDQEIEPTNQGDEKESEFESKKRRAFLDLMLIAAKQGADLNETDIRNEVDTFMFEGHDTTASATVWFLYCMATHPDHQERVREELNHVFGDSNRGCTAEDATQLKYLERCIKESLRLYPSVPNIKRRVSEDIVLEGYTIPAGATISMHIYALHRNEAVFPDPLAFKPERFESEQFTARHPFAFVPFSAGPRNCIGQRFALFEEKVILSTLLRRFRFVYDTAKHGPAKPCADLILKPHHGMPMIITPINHTTSS